MSEVDAKLKLTQAVSAKGKIYQYVGIIVDGEEIHRIFLSPLEITALFGKNRTPLD